MATLDDNGILFYEETDPISPIHTLLNTGQQSVSNAFGEASRIWKVDNAGERNALAVARAASAANPVYVHQADAPVASRLKVSEDPTGNVWRTIYAGDDTGWISASLQNGWVNFGGAYSIAEYRRLNGIVYVQGLIKSGTINPGTVLFNLPVGFRPRAYFISPAWGNGGGSAIEVAPNGNVVVGDISAFTLRQSISILPFPADQ